MLFRQGDNINSDYKQRFKGEIEVSEVYNGGGICGNITGATAREITILGLNTETEGDVEKAHILARRKYLVTAFLLSLDRRQYMELILSRKNYYAKQKSNCPRTLTNIYGLMVAFEPTRSTPVARGRNPGLDLGPVVANSETTGDGDHGSSGVIWRKLERWKCGGENLERNCPKREKEKEKKKIVMMAPTINELS